MIYSKIKEIIDREWDPIGVYEMGVTDEYDDYLNQIFIIASSKKLEELIIFMDYLVEDRMGLNKMKSHNRIIAIKLISLIQ